MTHSQMKSAEHDHNQHAISTWVNQHDQLRTKQQATMITKSCSSVHKPASLTLSGGRISTTQPIKKGARWMQLS